MKKFVLTLVVLTAMISLGSGLQAGTILIQEGLVVDGAAYNGTSALWMRSGTGDGIVNSIMRVGRQSAGFNTIRGLMRFGALSPFAGVNLGFSATDITSATLTLTTDTAFEGAGTIELRTVDPTDNNWQPGLTTWNQKRTDIPENWVGGGGVGTNYSGVIDTVNWINPGGNAGPTVTPLTFDLTGAGLNAVKDWVSGADTSAGFILRATDETTTGENYLDFYTHFTGTQANRPLLTINYVPEPATMALLGLGGLWLRRRRGQ